MPKSKPNAFSKRPAKQLIHKIKRGYALLPLHWLLAVLVALHGYVLIRTALPAFYSLINSPDIHWLDAKNIQNFLSSGLLAVVPRGMLGGGLVISAIGLALRARTAWFMALLLLIGNLIYSAFTLLTPLGLDGYTVLLIVLLMLYGRRFNQSSVASGTLFAALGVSLLLMYSMLGTLYLGAEFTPPITDISNAFYFSIVAMSTVGFGDITPHSVTSRLFTVSIIVLGIAIFATSISAVIGPILRGRIQHLVKGKLSRTMKKNHIIIVGVSSLAQSVYAALAKAGHDVVVIIPPDAAHDYPADTDIILGDATDTAVLTEANASQASYVLALRNDDSENAFIVLAAREAGGTQTRTVALVNTAIHLNKIKQVNPDVILSLQSLGAEILARLVTGEPITDELINKLLFPLDGKKVTPPSST